MRNSHLKTKTSYKTQRTDTDKIVLHLRQSYIYSNIRADNTKLVPPNENLCSKYINSSNKIRKRKSYNVRKCQLTASWCTLW